MDDLIATLRADLPMEMEAATFNDLKASLIHALPYAPVLLSQELYSLSLYPPPSLSLFVCAFVGVGFSLALSLGFFLTIYFLSNCAIFFPGYAPRKHTHTHTHTRTQTPQCAHSGLFMDPAVGGREPVC